MTASAVQFDFFASAPARVERPLRPYQTDAVKRIREELESNRSTLLVLPTGTGKTRTFSEVAKGWDGHVLVIAHRTELITQARGSLEENCGELVSTEKAEQRADGSRIVVGSVQTLVGDRLAAFARRHPATLVICDEAHHAVSPSYKAIFDAFPTAKLLGVTATPDRSDERAMGQVFDSVAYVYDLRDAIRDGYLCPIRIKQVTCGEIDLSHVGTVAGDLNQGELDAVMAAEEVIHKMVAPNPEEPGLIDLAGTRSTIVFCTSVDAAHRTAEIINRYKPDSARAVDGMTADDTRRNTLADHKRGRYQFLCNVGVLTEGYDSPGVACVAMMRPTKSRSLYAQCAGRGLRILDGKADCLLIDFVGNSGKHELVKALDLMLEGTWDDEVVAKARDIIEAQGMDGVLADDALARAQKEIDDKRAREAAKRLKIQATRVKRVVTEIDPFAMLDVENPESATPWAARYRAEPSEKQIAFLEKKGIAEPAKLSKAQASAIISKLIKNADAGLATYKQVQQLRKRGIETKGVSFNQARRVMDAIASNGWRPLAPAVLAAALARAPGEEG